MRLPLNRRMDELNKKTEYEFINMLNKLNASQNFHFFSTNQDGFISTDAPEESLSKIVFPEGAKPEDYNSNPQKMIFVKYHFVQFLIYSKILPSKKK